jgi:hypothetical protein
MNPATAISDEIRTSTLSGMSLGSRSLAIEGVVLQLVAAFGFGRICTPDAAEVHIPGGNPLEGTEKSPLRKHCAALRSLSGDSGDDGGCGRRGVSNGVWRVAAIDQRSGESMGD